MKISEKMICGSVCYKEEKRKGIYLLGCGRSGFSGYCGTQLFFHELFVFIIIYQTTQTMVFHIQGNVGVRTTLNFQAYGLIKRN